MANSSPSLFGPSAEEVRSAIDQRQQAEASARANMGWQKGITYQAARAGQGFGNAIEALGGYEPPEVARAKKLQEAQQEVDAMGVDLLTNPKEYYSAAARAMAKRGLNDEAMHVQQLMLAQEAQQAETGLKNAKTKRESEKGQSIGKGGLLLPDGTVVPPESTPTDTSKGVKVFEMPDGSMVQGQLGSPEVDAILKEGGKIASTKSSLGTAIERLASSNSEQASAYLQAAREDAAAKKGGGEEAKLGEEYVDELAKDFESMSEVVNQLDNIKSVRMQSDTTFGTWVEARRNLATAAVTLFPSTASAVNEFLKVRPEDVDAVERGGNNIILELAKEVGGGRPTNLYLKTLEKAGPAIWSTNTGLEFVDVLLRKKASKVEDKARYIVEQKKLAREGKRSHPTRFDGMEWDLANSKNPKYYLTPQDMAVAEQLVKKADLIRNYKKNSTPVPTDPNLLKKGKTYYSPDKQGGGYKFGKWDGAKMEILYRVK